MFVNIEDSYLLGGHEWFWNKDKKKEEDTKSQNKEKEVELTKLQFKLPNGKMQEFKVIWMMSSEKDNPENNADIKKWLSKLATMKSSLFNSLTKEKILKEIDEWDLRNYSEYNPKFDKKYYDSFIKNTTYGSKMYLGHKGGIVLTYDYSNDEGSTYDATLVSEFPYNNLVFDNWEGKTTDIIYGSEGLIVGTIIATIVAFLIGFIGAAISAGNNTRNTRKEAAKLKPILTKYAKIIAEAYLQYSNIYKNKSIINELNKVDRENWVARFNGGPMSIKDFTQIIAEKIVGVIRSAKNIKTLIVTEADSAIFVTMTDKAMHDENMDENIYIRKITPILKKYSNDTAKLVVSGVDDETLHLNIEVDTGITKSDIADIKNALKKTGNEGFIMTTSLTSQYNPDKHGFVDGIKSYLVYDTSDPQHGITTKQKLAVQHLDTFEEHSIPVNEILLRKIAQKGGQQYTVEEALQKKVFHLNEGRISREGICYLSYTFRDEQGFEQDILATLGYNDTKAHVEFFELGDKNFVDIFGKEQAIAREMFLNSALESHTPSVFDGYDKDTTKATEDVSDAIAGFVVILGILVATFAGMFINHFRNSAMRKQLIPLLRSFSMQISLSYKKYTDALANGKFVQELQKQLYQSSVVKAPIISADTFTEKIANTIIDIIRSNKSAKDMNKDNHISVEFPCATVQLHQITPESVQLIYRSVVKIIEEVGRRYGNSYVELVGGPLYYMASGSDIATGDGINTPITTYRTPDSAQVSVICKIRVNITKKEIEDIGRQLQKKVSKSTEDFKKK